MTAEAFYTPAYIGLGANLGATRQTLEEAAARLAAHPCTRDVVLSPFYSSSPVDADGPDYTNAVLRLETNLSPQALLVCLQQIEQSLGRQRLYRNAPRTIDLDILLFGELELDSPDLQIPHPRMHERAFVLQPLSELEPNMVLRGRSLGAWLEEALHSGQTLYRLEK